MSQPLMCPAFGPDLDEKPILIWWIWGLGGKGVEWMIFLEISLILVLMLLEYR